PTPSQYRARSPLMSMSEGSSVGWYLPISSITRPSRLVRESATTTRKYGARILPKRLRRILTATVVDTPELVRGDPARGTWWGAARAASWGPVPAGERGPPGLSTAAQYARSEPATPSRAGRALGHVRTVGLGAGGGSGSPRNRQHRHLRSPLVTSKTK